jgi:putative SOS response-associated peptidase YedK
MVCYHSATVGAPQDISGYACPNFQPRFNVCPTDPVDTIVAQDGTCKLVEMRWGLVPYWWSKPLKELRLATFNARVETVTTKPFFREPFKRRHCLMPVLGYYEWEDTPGGQTAALLYGSRRLSGPDHRRSLG